MKLIKSSYKEEDVTFLIQDITGEVEVVDVETAERKKQVEGVHYSEILVKEEKPSEEYIQMYRDVLREESKDLAFMVGVLAEKIVEKKGEDVVLVSLARGGTPIGILLKRYIEYRYNIEVEHYSVSIIRKKGIDKVAMREILKRHNPEDIQFVDGWVGKGVIGKELAKSCEEMIKEGYTGLNSELAVITDPAVTTDMYGVREDTLVLSSYFNAIISGLISRTVAKEGVTDQGYHGAVYYEEFEDIDISNNFIDAVTEHFKGVENRELFERYKQPRLEDKDRDRGIREVRDIAKVMCIEDIDRIKPGLGETTRVLIRRVPEVVLIRDDVHPRYLKHIFAICEKKGVEIIEYPLENYNAVGIIEEITK